MHVVTGASEVCLLVISWNGREASGYKRREKTYASDGWPGWREGEPKAYGMERGSVPSLTMLTYRE